MNITTKALRALRNTKNNSKLKTQNSKLLGVLSASVVKKIWKP